MTFGPQDLSEVLERTLAHLGEDGNQINRKNSGPDEQKSASVKRENAIATVMFTGSFSRPGTVALPRCHRLRRPAVTLIDEASAPKAKCGVALAWENVAAGELAAFDFPHQSKLEPHGAPKTWSGDVSASAPRSSSPAWATCGKGPV
jgi:hypothetical protein